MPAGHSTGRSRLARRASLRAERRRRLRRTLIGSVALIAASATAYAYAMDSEETAPTVAGGSGTASRQDARGGGGDTAPDAAAQGGRHSPSPSSSPAHSAARPSKPPPASPAPSTSAPAGPARPGVFTASSVAGPAQGKGPALRWRLEVEEGSGVDPNTAAHAVEAILGDPRGWTKDPAYGFQLTGPGQPVDFTVKIATPTTTDRLCEVVTPELIGETNCRAGHTVVVNLKRWQEGSPQFDGPVEEYRALIVNHEVGHEIGREHESCPGPGKPAPAMMQQIKGLLGCKANAWPFDPSGTYLSGPRVP